MVRRPCRSPSSKPAARLQAPLLRLPRSAPTIGGPVRLPIWPARPKSIVASTIDTARESQIDPDARCRGLPTPAPATKRAALLRQTPSRTVSVETGEAHPSHGAWPRLGRYACLACASEPQQMGAWAPRARGSADRATGTSLSRTELKRECAARTKDHALLTYFSTATSRENAEYESDA